MAKERLINTKLWSDGWIRKINPLDRYLFLYLLTNEHNNISGIYELALPVMAFESGLDERDLEKTMLPRLRPKVFYIEEWVIIPNFPRHQHKNSPKIKIGIEKELSHIPSHIINTAIGYGYHIDTQSHLNLNSNLNLKRISSEKKSPLNSKNMKTYNENDFSDSEETIIDSDTGEPISKKVVKEKIEGKNKIALRLQNKFAELCRKNLGTTPILNITTYKNVLFALNSGGLTEKQIEDLFDEWFSLTEKKDEQLISISQALSKFNIDGYKVRNQIK